LPSLPVLIAGITFNIHALCFFAAHGLSGAASTRVGNELGECMFLPAECGWLLVMNSCPPSTQHTSRKSEPGCQLRLPSYAYLTALNHTVHESSLTTHSDDVTCLSCAGASRPRLAWLNTQVTLMGAGKPLTERLSKLICHLHSGSQGLAACTDFKYLHLFGLG
jgi:hypothetical protein